MAEPELWLVRGKHPVLWTVPFLVAELSANYFEMINAVPLLARQHRAVSLVLDQVCASKANSKWKLKKSVLPTFAEKLPPGTDPESVFSWERPKSAQEERNQKVERADKNAFIDKMYQRGVGDFTRDQLEWLWMQFCKQALDWIVNEERPLDMYFLKLHPSRLRPNWRQYLVSRFPFLGRTLSYVTKSQGREIMDKNGFVDSLLSLDLLAMHGARGYCYSYVEVEYSKQWRKETKRAEQVRLRTLGFYGYARFVAGSMRRQLASHIKVYRQWLADIALPSAQVVECGDNCEYRFAPHNQPTVANIRNFKTVFVPTIVPNKLPQFKPNSDLDRLLQADGLLPNVPPVQQPAADVRDSGADVPKPTEQAAGDMGLLV